MTQNKFQAANENNSKRFWVETGFRGTDGKDEDNSGWMIKPSKTEVLKEILSLLEEGEELNWFLIMDEKEFEEDYATAGPIVL